MYWMGAALARIAYAYTHIKRLLFHVVFNRISQPHVDHLGDAREGKLSRRFSQNRVAIATGSLWVPRLACYRGLSGSWCDLQVRG